MSALGRAELEALIEEATVDAYGEDEQLTGLFTMLEEHLDVPFATVVLGVEVTVRGVDLTADGRIVALCSRGRVRQSLGILDLPLPASAPSGAEWIGARTGSQERTERDSGSAGRAPGRR
ncbi:hypothetical protein ABZ154_14845 [Streptomyces sp. NPDC006261]|uniref:hypothetical protein n=1 Tax=Streptomyces sp. NPDC006261 TaxID=3156739 RepID=UPI0033AC79D8